MSLFKIEWIRNGSPFLSLLTTQMRGRENAIACSKFKQWLWCAATQDSKKRNKAQVLIQSKKICSTNCEWTIGCGFFSVSPLLSRSIASSFHPFLVFTPLSTSQIYPWTEKLELFSMIVWIVCLLLYSLNFLWCWCCRYPIGIYRGKKKSKVEWNLKLE